MQTTETGSPLVRYEDIETARETLKGVISETSMDHSRALGRITGSTVHLKCENLQRAGSFKVRGAYVRIARLSAAGFMI